MRFFRVLTLLLSLDVSLVVVFVVFGSGLANWQEQQICCIDSFFVAWQGAVVIKLKLTNLSFAGSKF